MFIKSPFSLCALAFATLLGASSLATAQDPIICAEDAFIPFSFGNGTGLSNEIVTAAFKASGINVKIQVYPFSTLMIMVKKGEVPGGFNAVPTDETKAEYLFGSEPIFMTHMNFFYNTKDPVVINTESEISAKIVKGKIVVGDVSGYIYPPLYTKLTESKAIKTESVSSDEILIKKLSAGQNTVALMTTEVANYHINKLGLKSTIACGTFAWETPLYIAFSKKHPQSPQLMAAFDKGIKIIKTNGTYKSIIFKYAVR